MDDFTDYSLATPVLGACRTVEEPPYDPTKPHIIPRVRCLTHNRECASLAGCNFPHQETPP